jgi:hypothetical protein
LIRVIEFIFKGDNLMPKPTPRPSPAHIPPLEIPEDLETTYVNLARITHSPSELVLDFAHLLPGTTPTRIRARMIMSPLGAKLFHRALSENLSRYEAAFGEIKIPGEKSLADFLFRPSSPPDQPPEKPEK